MPQLRPVPSGVSGELYIGGAGLARGYLDRPELTAERFVPNPYAGEPGAAAVPDRRPGALPADGNVEFLGRLDHQVKIRGFRIEVGEIEAALAKHPDVRETVVLARESQAGAKAPGRLPHDGPKDAIECQGVAGLPEERAARVHGARGVRHPGLPSADSKRKVDRQALPEPEAMPSDRDETYAAPSTPQEEILVDMWSQLLGVATVGVHDNFFDLGGHSLLATQLVSRVREAFKVDLPVAHHL